MNPYTPPSTTVPSASVPMVAVGILTTGIIGLGVGTAFLCGVACYLDIGGETDDDVMAVLISFGAPLIALACIGIPAGLIHLRQRTKLDQIPLAAYLVALMALVVPSVWGNSFVRWLSISMVCDLIAVVVSTRMAVRYQHACDG